MGWPTVGRVCKDLKAMIVNNNETVRAAQEAFMDVLELAEQAAQGAGSEGSEALRGEAQATVLMLIAGIMLADGKYDPQEQEFIRLLVDLRDKPGGEVSYLNEYAARWAKAAMEVPRFFQAAVRRDAGEGTDIARPMLRRIQLIGNYASICDGKFSVAEQETVKRYVAFLEDFIEAWGEVKLAEGEDRVPGDSGEPSSLGTQPAVSDAGNEGTEDPGGDTSEPRGWLSVD